MRPETAARSSNRFIRLMLVEDDPILRLGFKAALEPFPDLQIILEADSSTIALQLLRDRLGNTPPSAAAWEPGLAETIPDLVIVSLELEQSTTGTAAGLRFCQQVQARYPTLPMLLIGTIAAAAGLAGVPPIRGGFCLRTLAPTDLADVIRQVSAGQPFWQVNPTTPNSPAVSPLDARSPAVSLSVWTLVKHNTRISGLQQIDAAIAQIEAQLRYPKLSLLDELVLTGRRRELRAARWLVGSLLATPHHPALAATPSPVAPPVLPSPPPTAPITPPRTPTERAIASSTNPVRSPIQSSAMAIPEATAAIAQPSAETGRAIRAALFDTIARKLQSSLVNQTRTPLEIDLFREERKRELFYIILRKLEEVLDELWLSQVPPAQVLAKQQDVLQDLWRAALTDFFGRYYTLSIDEKAIEIVDVLLQDRAIVEAEILSKIPDFGSFLDHVLFQTPLAVDEASYSAGSVEAMARAQIILENTLIQVANAVVQPLINRFGNVERIKQNFYDRRRLSTREVERFRNDLSWKYRVERYFTEPTAIFESRHILFVLGETGIIKTPVYAPRNTELANLTGIPLAVTLALEARDAIAPRLQSTLSFLGNGVVYLLTDVIGRGIGLIGRGFLKGIGSALQDGRVSRGMGRGR